MLILDKQKAIDRMVALTGQHEPEVDAADGDAGHARRRQRVATFERRAPVVGSVSAERRTHPAASASPAPQPG